MDVIEAMIWVLVAAVSLTLTSLLVIWVRLLRQDISVLRIDEELENITQTREAVVVRT